MSAYKDKIEVSLDGRQVFYLFFGGAIIACLVFVLGVMVGKRVEARAHVDRAAATTAARDPLAALDRLQTDGRREMSFRQALTGGAMPASDVDRAIAEMETARNLAAGQTPVAVPDKKPDDKPAAKPASDEEPSNDVNPTKPAGGKPVAKPAAAAKPVEPPKPAEAPKPKPKFALQLSAFQDRSEADAFMIDIRASGYDAYITEANVEGKGTFYRVRVGNFITYDEAVVAKDEFERKVKKIAYVSRI
jgi:cell division septation protein DedD